MTILFAGTEREALQQGAVGTFSENSTAGYFRAAWSRAAALASTDTSQYTAPFSDGVAEGWLHFMLRTADYGGSYGGTTTQIAVRDSVRDIIRIRNTAVSGVFDIAYYNGSTYVAIGTFAWAINTLCTYDLHFKAGAGDGVIALYKDDALLLQATNLTLAPTSNEFVQATFLPINVLSPWRYSEVVVSTVSTLQWGCKTAPPAANGTDTDGTGAVTDVNEINMDTGTYVQLDTAGNKRSFTLAARAVENFVMGVTAAACARRVDGTGPQNIRPYLIIGGTRYYGTTFALDVTFKNFEYTWDNNPATTTDWTTAEVNDAALEMGWEAVA